MDRRSAPDESNSGTERFLVSTKQIWCMSEDRAGMSYRVFRRKYSPSLAAWWFQSGPLARK